MNNNYFSAEEEEEKSAGNNKSTSTAQFWAIIGLSIGCIIAILFLLAYMIKKYIITKKKSSHKRLLDAFNDKDIPVCKQIENIISCDPVNSFDNLTNQDDIDNYCILWGNVNDISIENNRQSILDECTQDMKNEIDQIVTKMSTRCDPVMQVIEKKRHSFKLKDMDIDKDDLFSGSYTTNSQLDSLVDELDVLVNDFMLYYEKKGVNTPQGNKEQSKKIITNINEHINDKEFPLSRYCDIISRGKTFTEHIKENREQYNPVELSNKKLTKEFEGLTEWFNKLYIPCEERLNE